ncbi:CNB1 [Symbiodinium sp. KB8]|nr:CNB1 [Symbiodinium sp. KB8]
MDKDGTGVVDLDEFYRFFKLERSPFADRVFSIMGEPFVASRRLTNRENDDASGEISFREFVVCLWNYLSLDIKSLMRFCFDLFDQDLSGYLDIAEMHELLREVYGDSFETNGRLKHLMEELDANGDGRLSFEEFKGMNLAYPSMLFPAFRIQQLMRDKVFGAAFWNVALKNRIKMGAGATATIWDITKAVDDARRTQCDDELGALQAQRWRNPLEGPSGYHPEPKLSREAQRDPELAKEELSKHVDEEWRAHRATAASRGRYKKQAKDAGDSPSKPASRKDRGAPAAAASVAVAPLRKTEAIAESGLGAPQDDSAGGPTRLQKRMQRALAFAN